MKSGLVSITFRQLSPSQIVDLCLKADVSAIEWGGDIHVPHGEVDIAREVGQMTRDAGLEIASYGSYYKSVDSENGDLPFSKVLETAVALGAPRIRVWAGGKGSADASPEYRSSIVENLRTIAAAAAEHGVVVDLEYHANTLTDDNASAVSLMREVNHPNLRSLWQPSFAFSYEEQVQALVDIAPWLDYLHVYTWIEENGNCVRHPLAKGELQWKVFFEEAAKHVPPYALIEFVADDRPEQFLEDAKALNHWLNSL
ncbi:sugar phosphate isomerase/epimerase family protein [Rubellicoccus peritrichatus]|uniref:TIM barrel protein n=1 Tax=Rubellicoccus peritrichatus TaxID=3080537 RepID=A0AAQ3QPS8_9BACT|nr:TIM barrel protein [Puniceicoccus sp. CR14]WOO39413.1 TIM barrel protein [Puniceicoccus sp. CR14]